MARTISFCQEPGSSQQETCICIDYSQAVNQYTGIDAYPPPRIDDMLTNLALYRVFSTFDQKNAYHQFPICDSNKKYSVFKQMVGYISSAVFHSVSQRVLLYSKDRWI